jgi:glycosyltransferase involved in cell wall biosynthesis
MNFLFISDYSLEHTIGGAQRSNDIILKECIKRNHNVTVLNIDTDEGDILKTDYDIVISSNLEAFNRNKPHVIKYLQGLTNHVRLEHDMCRYLSTEDRILLYGNCIKSFFLTQYHYDRFKEEYGDIFKNIEIVPDPIDTSVFYDKNMDRLDRVLYAGFLHPLKGSDHFAKFTEDHPEMVFDIIGWGDPKYKVFFDNLDNVNYLGGVRYEDMPLVFNSYLSFYCCPIISEPFCRTFAEAHLCGIKNLYCNDMIGSLHDIQTYGNEEFKIRCGKAQETFWEKIESL